MRRRPVRFALCVKNEGYAASLELLKLYRTLPDPGAEKHLMRRIIDESGEDYLYPRDYFVDVPLPSAAKRAVAAIADQPRSSRRTFTRSP